MVVMVGSGGVGDVDYTKRASCIVGRVVML